MLPKKEVQHIAKLARLGLTEKETKKYQKELSAILDYVGKLKQIDAEISELPPTSHPLKVKNVTREDKEKNTNYKLRTAKKLMDLMPETKNSYLKVKSILK